MKKLWSVLLATATIFAAAGCGETGKTSEGSQSSADAGEENKAYRVLNDFEDYGTGVEPLLLLNYFGKVSLNTDKEYVKSGECSLKAMPEGCSSEGRYSPILKQPLRIEKSGKDYRDVSRFKMVSTQIYNASDDAVSMKMQMQFFDGYQTNTQTYTLQKGWNTVVYNVDPQILDISYDISDCKGLLYIFDPPAEGNAPTLYFDDIRIYLSEGEFVPLDTSVDKNEVCSFDKLYQEYVVIPNIKYPDFAPTLEINTDLNYVKSGKSLKVSMPKNDGSFTTYTYTGFSLNKEFVHSVGLDEYDGEQYFSFWIYNDGSSRQRLFIEFFDYGGVKYYKKTDIYVNAGDWHNVRIKMSDLSGNASAMTTGNAGEIYISWEINSLTEDRVIYFDSFEICD